MQAEAARLSHPHLREFGVHSCPVVEQACFAYKPAWHALPPILSGMGLHDFSVHGDEAKIVALCLSRRITRSWYLVINASEAPQSFVTWVLAPCAGATRKPWLAWKQTRLLLQSWTGYLQT